MATLPVYRESDGVLVNVIEAEVGFDPGEGLVLGTAGGVFGDTWNGSSYTKVPEPIKPVREYLPSIEEVVLELTGKTQSDLDAAKATIIARN